MPVAHQKSHSLTTRPRRAASGTMPSGSASPAHQDSSTDNSSLLARGGTPSTDAAANPEPITDESQSDTSGMTQMASGETNAASEESANDDLAALRQRVRDRQPPLPELGALKSSGTPRIPQNGWVRF
jgi:hypothetical protein